MNRHMHTNSTLRMNSGQPNSESMGSSFRAELESFSWRQREPTLDSPLPDWLAELRQMRGRVLYDQGRRPCFQMSDGKFDDPDPTDLLAHHVVAQSEGRPVGCARIVPSKHIRSGFVAGTIGGQGFEAILEQLGTNPEQVCEASRWAVVRECRGLLGRQIVVAAWAVARRLSFPTALVLAVTCQKQDLALIRMGARPVPGLRLFPSTISNDQCRLLYFDVWHPSEWMEKQITEMTDALKLGYLPPPVEVQARKSGSNL
jgi:hypothetical protein